MAYPVQYFICVSMCYANCISYWAVLVGVWRYVQPFTTVYCGVMLHDERFTVSLVGGLACCLLAVCSSDRIAIRLVIMFIIYI